MHRNPQYFPASFIHKFRLRTLTAGTVLCGLAILSMNSESLAQSCSLNAYNVNLGTIDSISSHPVTSPARMTAHCTGVNKDTRYCFMIYPNNKNDIDSGVTGYSRVLWLNGAIGKGNPFAQFQFLTPENQVFGAGTQNQDYGTPYIGKSAGTTQTQDFIMEFTAVVGAQSGMNLLKGQYTNTYNTRIYATNSTLTDQYLCSKSKSKESGKTTITAPMTVSATLKPACRLTVGGALNFDKHTNFEAMTKTLVARSSVTVECSGMMNYAVGINGGDHKDGNGINAMKCSTEQSCGQNIIQYLIYSDSGNIWNSDRPPYWTQTGKMDDTGSATYNITAKTIPPGTILPRGCNIRLQMSVKAVKLSRLWL